MFETAVLTNGLGARRAWTTAAGISAQAALLCAAVLIPVLFPDAMPAPQTWMTIFLPGAPPPPAAPAPARAQSARTTVARPFNDGVFRLPANVPTHVDMTIEEPAPPEPGGPGVFGGVPGGGRDGVAGALLTSLLDTTRFATPVPPVSETKAKPAIAETHAPIRVRVGGIVKPAVPIRRIEPVYPPLARQMRIAGVVELTGVIGTDGRIKELKVLSGHPLLAPAAVEAVRQWLYAPTTLNGEPVEVISPITVTFRLN